MDALSGLWDVSDPHQHCRASWGCFQQWRSGKRSHDCSVAQSLENRTAWMCLLQMLGTLSHTILRGTFLKDWECTYQNPFDFMVFHWLLTPVKCFRNPSMPKAAVLHLVLWETVKWDFLKIFGGLSVGPKEFKTTIWSFISQWKSCILEEFVTRNLMNY